MFFTSRPIIFYQSRYNVPAGLCAFTGEDIMYQQAYVLLLERIYCTSRPKIFNRSGYNVPAGLCSLLERI